MDLTTDYLGLSLRSPLVASAGPLTGTVTGVRMLADAGVGAVVLHSLFEEQVRAGNERTVLLEERGADANPEATTYVATVPGANDSLAPRQYLSLLERAVEASSVPVIASLNGSSLGGWTEFAKELQDAGAAALELNVYFVPGDVHTSGEQVERRHLDIVGAVKQAVEIPVAVKLSSAFSSVGNMCVKLDEAGADGLVLFNRFLQPDIDIETLEVRPEFALSNPDEGRLPRTWIAALRGRVKASLAQTTGVASAEDVIKGLLAGADVVMSTAALVRNGPGYAGTMQAGLEGWMERKGYGSVDDFRGLLAVPLDADADAWARGGYVTAIQKAKQSYGSLAG